MLFRKRSKKTTQNPAVKSTWKKDVILLFTGAIVSLGSTTVVTILTNHESEKKDFLIERRQKLEILVTDIYLEETCTLNRNAGNPVNSDCQSDIPAYRSMTYAKLYFPELYQSVATFQAAQMKAQSDMMDCLSDSKGRGENPMQARAHCFERYMNNPELKKISEDVIIDRAHKIEQDFAP